MSSESVVFEIQIEKSVLEQIFTENKHLKESYNKLIESEEERKTLTNLRSINNELIQENNKLKSIIKQMEQNKRINEERNKSSDLNRTESKLLKMKLENSESEKSKLVEQYEKETKILDGLLRDNTKLQTIEDQLKQTNENLTNASEELKKTKKQLTKIENENKELDKEKLNLELEIKNLTRKLRLEEERNKSNDLEHVECKLLKLKLHSVENEKKYLLEEFERERKIMTQQNKPRVAKLEENIKHLRRWIEKEGRERRPHDSDEVKALKEQIHALENDRNDLIEGFELERKVFRKIIKASENEF